MADTCFVLIRHAESTWNAAGRWQGQADPILSERGRAQARQLATALADQPVDVLVASDLARTLETAEIVGAALGLPVVPDPRFRELDVGGWAGSTRAQIEAVAPEMLARFEAGEPDVRAGGAESRREIRVRVRAAAAELARRYAGRRVALVTHLGVIRALLPGAEPGNADFRCVGAAALTGPEAPNDT